MVYEVHTPTPPLLAAVCEEGLGGGGWGVQAMKAAGVRPSLLTFNTLISCCQQAQRLEDAFQLKVHAGAE